jgi:ABC-2 type transport system permease protein
MSPVRPRTSVVTAHIAMGFRRWSTYRLATAAGAFTNSIFGLIKAYITIGAVGAAGGTLGGYDAVTGATYAWLAQALLAPVNVFGWQELALRIRTGDISIDLARPVDPQLAFMAADLGRAAYSFIPRGAPPLMVGALVTGLALPAAPLPYLLAALSLLLAVMVSFSCLWLVNLTAFWLLDLRGVTTLYMVACTFLSGMVVPIHWFPGWLATVAAWTPFPSLIQTPIDIVTARAEGADALILIGTQALWLSGMIVVGRLVFRAGAKRLVVQGG